MQLLTCKLCCAVSAVESRGWRISYLSRGQGLTRDTLEEVTEAEDLWPQSRDTRNPARKPSTKEARPVTTAMVTACNISSISLSLLC